MTDDFGVTPLHVEAHQGHLEVVHFLVGAGSNNDQGTTDDGATNAFLQCISAMAI